MTQSLKYARIERERRFLAREPPAGLERDRYDAVEDLYIAGTRLRLRRVCAPDGRVVAHKLTQKIATDTSHRITTSLYLDAAEWEHCAALPGSRIVKRRHHHRWRGVEWGVDVFDGALAGLVLIEAEAASDALLCALPVPQFAHCEVTDCTELSGAVLAATDPARTLAFARAKLAAPSAATAAGSAQPTVAVRNLVEGDPAPMSRAFAAMGWQKPETLFWRYLDEQRAGARDALVAERGGELAGYVTIVWSSRYVPFAAAGIPEIEDLNVVAKHRRRGVACALLDTAEARIASRSSEIGIGVGLHPGYNAAQRLYGLRGYVPDGRGVTRGGVPIAEGGAAVFDDDLVLHLTKSV